MAGIRMHCNMFGAPGVARRGGRRRVVHLVRVGVVALAGETGSWTSGLARRASSKVDVRAIILVWLAHFRQAMPGAWTGEGRARRSCLMREHLGFEQVIGAVGVCCVGMDGERGDAV